MRNQVADKACHSTQLRPVDLVHLSRQTLGNRALEREVLGLFATQSVACVDKLRAAACQNDRLVAAHTLKGSAQGIGAWNVVKAAEALEAVERELIDLPSDEEAQDRLAGLVAEVATANAYICTLLSDD